ncbi:MAG: cytochrome c1 [Pseudomonadota bacterium]
MRKSRIIPAIFAASLAASGTALAAGGKTVIEDPAFSFEGPFGTYDRMQLQRGFQVFQEVCSGCHGMKFVSFRSLGESGGPEFPPEQIKAFASNYELPATPGEPFVDVDGERVDEAFYGDMRAALPTDNFPANDSVGAPDLSLMAKARAGFHGPSGLLLNQLRKGIGGPEYIYSLLVGYVEEPECAAEAEMDGQYNNAFAVGAYPDSCKVFDEDGVEIDRLAPGSWISMSQPLYGEDVEYAMHGGEGDEGPVAPEATIEQQAEDVAAFLMWAAEPKMTDRKEAGFRNLLMILFLAVLLYYTNKKLWAPIKHREH